MMAMGLILYFCDPSNLSVKQSALFPGVGGSQLYVWVCMCIENKGKGHFACVRACVRVHG